MNRKHEILRKSDKLNDFVIIETHARKTQTQEPGGFQGLFRAGGGSRIFNHRFGNTWCFRSGGLGDFLLTVPFLKALRERSESLTVVTRRSFRALVEEDLPDTLWMDIDGREMAGLFSQPEGLLCERLRGVRVFSFVGEIDPDFRTNLETCGCESATFLTSRPEHPPHVTAQMFAAACMDVPADLFHKAWLTRRSDGGRGLWIHPGSGSPKKNAPLQTFQQRISNLMSRRSFEGLYVLLGEAERPLSEAVCQAFAEWRPKMIIEPDLLELRRFMEASAGSFVGNDTGPSHLAAMLGIPLEVLFVNTPPEIWRPLGPEVTVTDVRNRLP